jgi:hypothetical protein
MKRREKIWHLLGRVWRLPRSIEFSASTVTHQLLRTIVPAESFSFSFIFQFIDAPQQSPESFSDRCCTLLSYLSIYLVIGTWIFFPIFAIYMQWEFYNFSMLHSLWWIIKTGTFSATISQWLSWPNKIRRLSFSSVYFIIMCFYDANISLKLGAPPFCRYF